MYRTYYTHWVDSPLHDNLVDPLSDRVLAVRAGQRYFQGLQNSPDSLSGEVYKIEMSDFIQITGACMNTDPL